MATCDVIVSLLGDSNVDSAAGVIGVVAALYVSAAVRLSFVPIESVPVTSLSRVDVITPHAVVGRPDDVMTDDVTSRSVLCESPAVLVIVECPVVDVMTSLTDKASSPVVNDDVISDVIANVVSVPAIPVHQHMHYSPTAVLTFRPLVTANH